MGEVIPNPDAVTETLKRIFSPGDVFEIRALEATRQGDRRPHTESGYFDYAHIDAVGAAVKQLSFAKGVYYTPNPVLPSLLARAANRIRAVRMEPTTKDEEIVARRWLLVDCDPVRPAGISSTDEEHELAHARARELRDGLSSMGWPQPIYCDSGNGAQLLYRIDLPRDDAGLVKRVLEVFATTDDDKVKVDQSVSNPARIWRLPGTMNCRGDHIPNRPHRLAQVIDLPAQLVIVTKEQLEEVTGRTASCSPSGYGTHYAAVDISKLAGPAPVACEPFDIDKWIAQYCPEVEGPTDWQGGRKWIFPVCPFNESHTNRSAVIIQQSSGAIAFRCHHNGCRDYGWKELRDLKEPGRSVPKQSTPVIQPSVITPMQVMIEESSDLTLPPEPSIRLPDPGPLPETLLRIPGFVSQVMDHTLQIEPYPNLVTAFCGALALQSFLAGRKVRDPGDNRTNLYLLALAHGSGGKDHARRVNADILKKVGLVNCLGNDIASGEGAQDALFLTPCMLFQTDEIDSLLVKIAKDYDGSNEKIMSSLLTLYSSATSVYPMRRKAGKDFPGSIDQPSLTIFGTAIPEHYYSAMSSRMLTNGFFARMIILESGKRPPGKDPCIREIPEAIIETAKWWRDFRPGNSTGNLYDWHPVPAIVEHSSDAKQFLADLRTEADREYGIAEDRADETAATVWGRVNEHTRKLALIYAVSENHLNPMISKSAADWASQLVMHQTRRMLFMSQTYVADNPFHALCLKVIQRLQEQRTGRLDHSSLLKRMKVSAKVLNELIDTLICQGDITRVVTTRGGKSRLEYQLLLNSP